MSQMAGDDNSQGTVRDAVSNGTVGGTAASAAGAGDHGRVPTRMREESLTSYSGPGR